MNADDYYTLGRKYRDTPRKGWETKGSRAKSNETIEVNRKEVCDALKHAFNEAYASKAFLADAVFYEKMLNALADGEDDAVECDNCTGVYLMGWFDGKCPYCEVDHDGVLIITKKEKERK